MKAFLVVGLGRFGRHLTKRLAELGNEVMILDQDEEQVARLASVATAACVGDCQDEQVLASLGVRNFDVCFVCVRDDFQCSLEATATLKELGARCVVARADHERQIKFLKKIGADFVIHTEMDMAGRPCGSPPATPSTISS
jgi:trk system potassium uptake protein TrkA